MSNVYHFLQLNDLHLGLQIEGVDQTPDFEKILMQFIKHGIKLKKAGEDVTLIFNGDIFDSDDPSEALIGVIIRAMCLIKKYGIKTYFVVGNHEASSDLDRVSSLTFIKDAHKAFPTIKLIEDITMMKIGDCIEGTLYLSFLPHISKALMYSKGLQDMSPQDYIEMSSEKIIKKTEGKMGMNLIFSHLNVKGVHEGSEANLLKRSDVYVPNILTNGITLGIKPIIMQAHIHQRQQIGNMHITGNQVFCSFNETGEKGYAHIKVGKQIDDGFSIDYVETFPPKFVAIEIDLRGKSEDFFKQPEIRSLVRTNDRERKLVIKIDVTVNAENNNYDWATIQSKLQKHFKNSIVKKIVPRIITKKIVRNRKQKLGLPPDKAIRVFITKNWGKDPKKAKQIYKRSKKYTGAEKHESIKD